jgi:hypothetical protein
MGRQQQQQYDAVAGTNEEQLLNSTLDAGDWDNDPHHSSFENPTVIKGVKQPTQCRDLWAAILFYIQLLTCITIACVYGVPAISRSSSSSSGDSHHGSSRSSSNDADDYEDYKGLLIGKKTESIIIYAYLTLLEVSFHVLFIITTHIFPPHTHSFSVPFIFFTTHNKASLIAAIGAFTLSTLSLLLMSICPTFVIQLSLLTSLLWSTILAVCCFILLPYPGNVIGGCVCIVTLLLSLCYTLVIWKRIPFASTNLYTGIQAIKTNAGCILVVYGLVLLSIGYSLLWMTAVVGVYDVTVGAAEDDGSNSSSSSKEEENNLGWGYLFLLLLAYFW